MPLTIKETGLEQYAPGGEANIKMMIIGGPGAGKTRMASFWPLPIYANCEDGLAAVADRGVPYVDIASSDDMLEFLKYLKLECSKPKNQRKFATVVVDTLDSFQRKVKDEWIRANNAASFGGFEAWGYLDAKMQMLMTRLLNLDMNVIVLAHYKDKTWTEGKGDNKVERHELMLQLQGDIKDSAFNDFDLVGWLGTYWESDEDLNRVQSRGLTFKPSPDRPFLKDRLYVTPEWMKVEFTEDDYFRLFNAFTSRLDELGEGGTVEEVGDIPDESPVSGEGVVSDLSGGPVPPQEPKEMPLDQLKKNDLLQMAREMPGIKDKVKSNMLKDELIQMISDERERLKQQPEEKAEEKEGEDTQTTQYADGSGSKTEPKQASHDNGEPASADSTGVQDGSDAGAPASEPDSSDSSVPQTPEEAVENLQEGLGGEVISGEQSADETQASSEDGSATDSGAPEAEHSQESSSGEQAERTCEECGKSLADENADYVKLSWIKFRQLLCNEDYLARKKAKA